MFKKFVQNSCVNIFLNSMTTSRSRPTAVRELKSNTRGSRSTTTHNKMMQRYWDPPLVKNSQKSGQKRYKLMSYNILAQDLLTEHLYLYLDTEPRLLTWEHRQRRLKEEIALLNPDILCIQEMQYSHLKTFVRNIRGYRKLEYVFKKKTGHRTDGCAIIYDKNKFKLIEEQGIEYYTPNTPLMNRENIALMAKFNLKEDPTKEVIVATTHLLFNPKRHDVRMAQVTKLRAALTAFSSTKGKLRVPILLTGDFNSEPQSPPYDVLTGSGCNENVPKSVKRANPLKFHSFNFGFNSASTHQNRWVTVDYILCSMGTDCGRIQIWNVYQLPDIRNCERFGKIPNKFLGSDHYSQAIVFSVG